MHIEIAKDGVGVARDCWEFTRNECSGRKKNCVHVKILED